MGHRRLHRLGGFRRAAEAAGFTSRQPGGGEHDKQEAEGNAGLRRRHGANSKAGSAARGGLEFGHRLAAEHEMQAAAFPDHDMDALYRHFSDFVNYFREAAGERALLRVAPAFADVALDDRHDRVSWLALVLSN